MPHPCHKDSGTVLSFSKSLLPRASFGGGMASLKKSGSTFRRNGFNSLGKYDDVSDYLRRDSRNGGGRRRTRGRYRGVLERVSGARPGARTARNGRASSRRRR